jgi:hypothetical protein
MLKSFMLVFAFAVAGFAQSAAVNPPNIGQYMEAVKAIVHMLLTMGLDPVVMYMILARLGVA